MSESERKTAICSACGLTQYQGTSCRRCKRPLPQPMVAKQVVIPTVCGHCGAIAGVLPTVEQAEAALIRSALVLTGGDKIKAARMIGIGKTSIFRKVKAMKAKREVTA